MSDAVVSVDELTDEAPENACWNYPECGNIVPENGEACGDCLDEARHDDP